MKIFIIGAGQVGLAIVEALHEEHEITVLDTEASRLSAFAGRYDVATFEGDGTSRRDLANAGVKVFVNKPMPPGPLRQAVMRLLQA